VLLAEAPNRLPQFISKDRMELVLRLTFDPRQVAAMVEQNEAKLLQDGGQRLAVCPQILHKTLTFTFDTRVGRLLASRSDQGCADCEHRLQHVGCSPVLHDAAINHSVEVHSGDRAILHHPALRSAKMTNAALRSEGCAGSEDVRFAVLENNGHVTVIPMQEGKTWQPEVTGSRVAP
jgi:hypothetical protein